MPTEVSGDGGLAGDVYADVIERLLQYERERKTSLEQKAISVITTSGALVSLLFGFVALNKSQSAPPLLPSARTVLIITLGLFVLAALVSLLVNSPVSYSPLGVKTDLRRMVSDELWDAPRLIGVQAIAAFRVAEIDHWRDSNGRKARLLRVAILLEIAGIALLAVAASLLLLRGYRG